MSDDTFMAPKQGRSTGSKIFIFLLLFGGGTLLLCCGGGFFWAQSAKPNNDPEKVRATTADIASIEIPSYFKTAECMNLNMIFMKMKMAHYELEEGLPIEVMVFDEEKFDQTDIEKKQNKVKKEDTKKGKTKKEKAKKKKEIPSTKKKEKDPKSKTDKKKKAVKNSKKKKTKMKKTVTKKSDGDLVLMWFSVWGMGDAEDEDRKEMREQMGTNSGVESKMDVDTSSSEDIVIKGESISVHFAQGKNRRTGRKIRSVEAVFSGKDNGMIFLFMQIPESLYDHDKIVEMLKNIK